MPHILQHLLEGAGYSDLNVNGAAFNRGRCLFENRGSLQEIRDAIFQENLLEKVDKFTMDVNVLRDLSDEIKRTENNINPEYINTEM